MYTWMDRVERKLNTNVCGRNPDLNPMERGEKKVNQARLIKKELKVKWMCQRGGSFRHTF